MKGGDQLCCMDSTYPTHRPAFRSLKSRTRPAFSCCAPATAATTRSRPTANSAASPRRRTRSDAEGEAAHMLRLLGGRKPALGVWLDMEDADGYKAKNGMPSDATLADICITFCDAMEQAGLYTGIYASLSWLETKLKTEKLGRFDKWVAQWNDTCDYTGAYSLWQYTDRYEIAGRKLDANHLVRDFRTDKGGNSMANKKSRVLMTGENQITQHYGSGGHGGCDLVKKTNQLDGIAAHSDGTVVWCQSGIPNDPGSSGNRSYGNAVKRGERADSQERPEARPYGQHRQFLRRAPAF